MYVVIDGLSSFVFHGVHRNSKIEVMLGAGNIIRGEDQPFLCTITRTIFLLSGNKLLICAF